MALDVYFASDLRAGILAGLVTTVNTARATGYNVEYLRGALSAYQHQALMFQIAWPGVLEQARAELGQHGVSLLDSVRMLEGGR